MKRTLFALAAALACTSVAVASPMVVPTQYSVQHHSVSTASAQAQAAFDEGLTLLYAFNRLAARNAFTRAVAADPNLAMAYWGIAESYGPNVNEPEDDASDKAASDAILHAKALLGHASEEEAAYIGALATRYSPASHPDYQALSRGYERAMSDLSHRYPDDLDAATLFAESEMDLHPWAWFTPAGQPADGTNEIIATLEGVLARDPMHIGANHYYIHATEESLRPDRALVAAARLGTFAFEPAAAHLVHMPAHTYMRTGFYDLAVMSNVHATEHDRAYLKMQPDFEASGYYDHNLYFLTSAYDMEGAFAGARAASVRMAAEERTLVPEIFVLCRFARWRDILAMPPPATATDEPMRIAMWHYARGLALASTGDLNGAERERQVLSELNRTTNIPSLVGWYNGSKQIEGLALDVLAAKLDSAHGRFTQAAALLVRAVRTQDSLRYIEPPDWYYPVRQSLGAALLRAGDLKGAERAFREDLVRNPRNGWSLFGLEKALTAQGDTTDAAWAHRAFAQAWRNADTQPAIEDL